MTSARVPASVVLSLGVHGGALALFGLLMSPENEPRRWSRAWTCWSGNETSVPPGRRAQTTLIHLPDFLKLALPTVPHSAAPAQLAIKIPEHKLALADAPKLEEHSHSVLPKLQALDLANHPDSAAVDVKLESRRQAAANLAALPRRGRGPQADQESAPGLGVGGQSSRRPSPPPRACPTWRSSRPRGARRWPPSPLCRKRRRPGACRRRASARSCPKGRC